MSCKCCVMTTDSLHVLQVETQSDHSCSFTGNPFRIKPASYFTSGHDPDSTQHISPALPFFGPKIWKHELMEEH